MHRLLRSKRTKAFLTAHGEWTDKIHNANHFPNHSLARVAVQKLQLRDMELYYSFNERATSQYDFAISL
jgi:hypothetical protein